MKLFKMTDQSLIIADEAYTLKAFKALWDRDTTKGKDLATMELAFVYFYTDTRSDYQYLTDDEERAAAIKEGIGLPESWCIDEDVQYAIDFYKSFKTTNCIALERAKSALNNLSKYASEASLMEITDRDTASIATSVSKIVRDMPSLVKSIQETELLVQQELEDADRTRGNIELTPLDVNMDF